MQTQQTAHGRSVRVGDLLDGVAVVRIETLPAGTSPYDGGRDWYKLHLADGDAYLCREDDTVFVER